MLAVMVLCVPFCTFGVDTDILSFWLDAFSLDLDDEAGTRRFRLSTLVNVIFALSLELSGAANIAVLKQSSNRRQIHHVCMNVGDAGVYRR
jgi:hypothetical protein